MYHLVSDFLWLCCSVLHVIICRVVNVQTSQCANKSMCQQVNVQTRQCANTLMSLSLQLFIVTNEQTSQHANKFMCQDRSLRTCSLGCSMAQHSSGFADTWHWLTVTASLLHLCKCILQTCCHQQSASLRAAVSSLSAEDSVTQCCRLCDSAL